LEKRKEDLTNQLNSGITDHVQLQQLSAQVKQLDEEIDVKTMRWLELSELAG